MAIVPYYPLGDDVLKNIIKLKLKQVGDRVIANYKAKFSYDDAVIESIASRCKEVETGARNADHIIAGTLLPELASDFLARMAEGNAVSRVHIGAANDGKFTYTIA
jgi:type VI secretion system protein VasG